MVYNDDDTRAKTGHINGSEREAVLASPQIRRLASRVATEADGRFGTPPTRSSPCRHIDDGMSNVK